MLDEEAQRIAVEMGESYASGWMNTSETRWGSIMFVVPNSANRIVFYPAGRPHSDFLPGRGMLAESARFGRLLLKSFWMTKRDERP